MTRSVKNPARRLQNASKRPRDAPTWCPRRPKSRPRGAQDASRTAEKLPKRRQGSGTEVPWSQEMPKRPPEPPKSCPDPLQTLILHHFGTDSHEMLYHLYVIFGGFGKVYSG